MFKKILIITDNVYLAKEFEAILNSYSHIFEYHQFGISPFSDLEQFKDNVMTDLTIIDMKNSRTISYILENFDLVFSVHCKQLFPKELVEKIKCINVHPGFNPLNRGWYPQVFSIIHDLPIGATIHEIDEKLDNGNIIARRLVKKNNWDTSKELYERVLDMEVKLIKENLKNILWNNYVAFPPENKGKLFLKNDFNELLEISLEEKKTCGDFIKKLRALTHGDYNNAFFYDPDTGKKIFLKLTLTPEGDHQNNDGN